MFQQRKANLASSKSRLTRAVACCLLVVFSVVSSGLPVPLLSVPELKTDRNESGEVERFPCEKCPCGCRTASHCWDKCCCKTDAQKIAWAKANKVQPPAFLIARVNSPATGQQFGKVVAGRKCCQETSVTTVSCKACCSKVTEKKPCCQAKQVHVVTGSNTSSSEKPVGAVAKPTRCKVVILDAMQRCNGLDCYWKLLQVSVMEPFPELCEPIVAECTGITYFIDAVYFSHRDEPDGPVPWSVVRSV